MKGAFARSPVAFPQLCAIARNVINQDTALDSAEWKARVKERLARLGFAEPASDALTRALDAVEHACAKEGVRIGPPPESARTPEPEPAPVPLPSTADIRAFLQRLGVQACGRAFPEAPRSSRADRAWCPHTPACATVQGCAQRGARERRKETA